MTLPINLSTGPVAISDEVINALASAPISHRSSAFSKLYNETTRMLSKSFCVQQTFLLTGSGTMANECMMQEIKQIGGQGLILSNGEFGSRLMKQALRNNITFIPYEISWGKIFDLAEIAGLLQQHSIQWILFCHGETSTGVINDMVNLAAICKSNNCYCFVDCMSTVGTMPLDLSDVSMATASSGKGLASIPGLAVVFCNIRPIIKKWAPVYLDLAYYQNCDGIPFTLSSNLLMALSIAIQQKLTKKQIDLSASLAKKIFSILSERNLVPFATNHSRVFTIVPKNKHDFHFLRSLQEKLVISFESDYLKKREWQQLAIFGYYTEAQAEDIERILLEEARKSYAVEILPQVEHSRQLG